MSKQTGSDSARPEQTVNLRRAATAIFGLAAVIPLLVLGHLLWTSDATFTTQTQIEVLLAVLTAALGFVLFQRMVGRISALIRSVALPEPAASGPAYTGAAVIPGLGHVSEIGDMATAFSRLLGELRTSTERLEDLVFKLGTLDDMVEMAARIPEIQDLLAHVLERTMRAVGARIGSIMLLDQEAGELRLVASRGLPDEIRDQAMAVVGQGIAGTVVEYGEAVLVDDVEQDPRFAKVSHPRYEGGSFICMPLKVGTRTVGVLNLARKDPGAAAAPLRAFTRTDLQFLSALMTYTAYAVDNARLLEEARKSAQRMADVVEDQRLRLTIAEQQVLQAAKLSALGQLVAGVAHELNNPLTVLTSGVEVLEPVMPATERATLEMMGSAVERARRIVRGLLSFSRETPLERGVVDVGQLVEEVLSMARGDLRIAEISAETTIEPGLPTVSADRNQIEQVLINLVTNARQAMAGIEGERHLRIEARRAGPDRVAINVADSGPGISADLITKVFDPFVTTKGATGTGLGLSISYGIVQKHGGTLRVDSPPGHGATFRIELPIGGPA